jgi:antitoxin HigA-1
MNNYMVVDKNGGEVLTDVTLHPGEVLALELEARGLKKMEFAEKIGMRLSHFSELLHAKRHVSEDLALRLEKALDIDAEFWMRVQVKYNLDKKRLEYAQNTPVMGVNEPEAIYKKVKQKKEI